MQYRLLLTNPEDGQEAEIVVPASMPLEELSPLIKVALQLPYVDHAWHRFLSHGTTYVVSEHLTAEPEIRFECNLPVGRYRCSEHVRLRHVFTVLHSAITYLQDDDYHTHKVRCTLLQRT